MITSQRSRNGQESHPEVHRLPATSEAEERKQSDTNNSHATHTSGRNSNNGNGFDVEGTHSAFQPWPSIEEVRARKEQLLKKTPLPFYKTHVQNTAPAPQLQQQLQPPQPGPSSTSRVNSNSKTPHLHRKYEPEASYAVSSTDDERRSASPSRRFRISVSPTRKLGTDASSCGLARRLMIKQESTAPSLKSVRQTTPPSSISIAENSIAQRAPTVEFGDDDSPRVLE